MTASDAAFLSTAAQVIPILFLALIWERARSARERPQSRPEEKLRWSWRAMVDEDFLTWPAAVLLIVGEGLALLALADPKDNIGPIKRAVGVSMYLGAALIVAELLRYLWGPFGDRPLGWVARWVTAFAVPAGVVLVYYT